MKLTTTWEQVDGDRNIADHGGTIARLYGDTIELREIQPTMAYVGREAFTGEDPFPFWTKEATYDLPIDRADPEVVSAARSCDIDLADPEVCDVQLACAMLGYGVDTDEGPCGWARDVFPPKGWYHCHPRGKNWKGKYNRTVGGAFFSDADAEFRRELRDYSR